MKKVGIVYLITEAPEARGVLEVATETRRKTYCEEKSLSMSETYQARASGFSPTMRLVLPNDFEYRGETLCEYRGERYKIIRDYRDEKTGDSTELTLERIRGNAAKTAPEPEPEPEPGPGPEPEPVTGQDSGEEPEETTTTTEPAPALGQDSETTEEPGEGGNKHV